MKAFVQGARTCDLELFCSGLERIENLCIWDRALRAVAKYSAPMDFRTKFAGIWLESGDTLRSQTNNDLALIEGLRALLPPYTGQAVRLYRGDGAWNRRCRTYGLSWTTDIEIARHFADDKRRRYKGGGVLLSTLAPTEAIISVPGLARERFSGENEYLVDRRRLTRVDVLERLAKIPLEQSEGQGIDDVEMIGWESVDPDRPQSDLE